VAPSFGLELRPVDVRDASEIEHAITSFARSSNDGLIVTASGLANVHRNLIVTHAAGIECQLSIPTAASHRRRPKYAVWPLSVAVTSRSRQDYHQCAS
jgi:hypothetical protein